MNRCRLEIAVIVAALVGASACVRPTLHEHEPTMGTVVVVAPDAGPEQEDAGNSSDAGTWQPADPAGFQQTGSLAIPRSAHTATLLADGRVLVVGGEDIQTRNPIASAELYDPATGTWAPAAALPEPRSNHGAILLDDGRVLVVGGGRSAPIGAASGLEVLASALLYIPAADRWEDTGDLLEGRSHFGAVKLPSGRVLVAGGGSGNHANGNTCTGSANCGPLGDTLTSSELYDPATGAFSSTGPMSEARSLFTMTLMPGSGEVISVAGMNDYRVDFKTTEIYREAEGVWSAGPQLAAQERVFHAAAPLSSGRLLVGGGKLPDTYMLATVDLVDPTEGVALRTASLSVPQTLPRFVPLTSGRVLSVGGYRCPNPCAPLPNAELYDEEDGSWTPLAPLATARAGHTATLLKDGRVLVVGGFDSWGGTTSCELSFP